VDEYTRDHLLEINRDFYRIFAPDFSSTRQRLQPGVNNLIIRIASYHSILDLGCGNGELYRALFRKGYRGIYAGIDFSSGLLNAAPGEHNGAQFFKLDLSNPEWNIPLQQYRYQLVTAFSVLHHLPGEALRVNVLLQAARLLEPNGMMMLSVWQFLNSEKLRTRILDWDVVGISTAQVDPDDYLLDWRKGGTGLRYVHHFTQSELVELAEITGFRVLETFLSDGENRQLGLYQIWKLDV